MDPKHVETLSAFFDGERVDAELLADSLSQPDASATLAEFAAMRARVQRDTCRPSPEFFDTMAETLRGSRLQRLLRSRLASWALAASLAAAVGIAGFLLGSGRARHGMPAGDQASTHPPTATHLVSASPAPTVPPPTVAAEKPADLGPPLEPAGPPRASLRLRMGQWHENTLAAAGEGGRH